MRVLCAIPKSRHNPQFSEEELAASLQKAGIAYSEQKNGQPLRANDISQSTGWEANVST